MSLTLPLVAGTNLDWDGLHNARDLGGHPTPVGPTRRRVLIRSEAPLHITEVGRHALREHGVTGFLDLRSDQEAEAEPSPFAGTRGYRRIAILDASALEHVNALATGADLLTYMLTERDEAIGAALLNLLDLSADGGVLFHCRLGRDRAGLLAALLLANAGVEAEAIAEDHARSEWNMEPLYAAWAQRGDADAARRIASARRFSPSRASMEVAMRMLEGRHGGVRRYLRWIGLSADEIAALRRILAPGRPAKRA